MAKKGEKQNRKTRAASRVNQVVSKLNNPTTKAHLNTFLIKYILCEISSKEMIVGYKSDIGRPVDYEKVKMTLTDIRCATNHYSLGLAENLLKRLFSSDKVNGCRSAKKLRDSIVHSITVGNISEVDNSYTRLISDMDKFLNAVTS
jgi:hypothetical protein